MRSKSINQVLLTCQQLQDTSGYQIGVRSFPTSGDSGKEGQEQEKKGHRVQSDYRSRHVCLREIKVELN